MNNLYRPGNGWKHMGGAVYENNGLRIHICGLIRKSNGEFLNGNRHPEIADMNRFIIINGGNRRRGIMAWAMARNAAR